MDRMRLLPERNFPWFITARDVAVVDTSAWCDTSIGVVVGGMVCRVKRDQYRIVKAPYDGPA